MKEREIESKLQLPLPLPLRVINKVLSVETLLCKTLHTLRRFRCPPCRHFTRRQPCSLHPAPCTLLPAPWPNLALSCDAACTAIFFLSVSPLATPCCQLFVVSTCNSFSFRFCQFFFLSSCFFFFFFFSYIPFFVAFSKICILLDLRKDLRLLQCATSQRTLHR